ncbi:type I-E CRISPR-associated protein Cas5/CasD [Streptosporangium sp. NPDC020072]|uniref:type I-E CRISPR-associated protein Cas5/CasD n=1 Tax=Streptosporangium sp. NPDC020072 TaxID=3154788 RepID=UPI00341D9B79
MSVLLMQLAGPLQSWGASSRFARRTTEAAPTKSGVIGLLAAAEGRLRTDDIDDLAALRFGVRIDQRGTLLRDFHTAHHFAGGEAMPVSERFYLSDAVFVAGVEGEEETVEGLYRALREPVFPLYLGRRSCPPSRPVELGVRHDLTLEEALRAEEWRAARWYQRRQRDTVNLEILVEGPGEDTLRDQPLSFDPLHRRYALRGVRHLPPVRMQVPGAVVRPGHDPMSALESV